MLSKHKANSLPFFLNATTSFILFPETPKKRFIKKIMPINSLKLQLTSLASNAQQPLY
jgi:hypothetical protein